MRHELWVESEEEQTFCLAGPHGAEARELLGKNAKLVWTCEADCHFDAMSKYYEHMEWGEYKSEYAEQDKITYKELGWE